MEPSKVNGEKIDGANRSVIKHSRHIGGNLNRLACRKEELLSNMGRCCTIPPLLMKSGRKEKKKLIVKSQICFLSHFVGLGHGTSIG